MIRIPNCPICRSVNHFLQMIVIGVGAGLGVMALDRTPPVVELSVDTHNVENAVPGKDVELRVTVDRKRLCDTDATLYIIDSDGTRFVPQTIVGFMPDRLGVVTFGVPFRLPKTIDPGIVKGYFRLQFHCNAVHYVWPIALSTPPFTFTVRDKNDAR